MITAGIYYLVTNKTIAFPALEEGTKKGNVRYAIEDRSNRVTMYKMRPLSVEKMGFSFWDQHKISIITNIVISLIILGICLGLGYGSSLTGKAWAITGTSLFVSAVCIDAFAFKVSIRRLSNKIKANVEANANENIKENNDSLDIVPK